MSRRRSLQERPPRVTGRLYSLARISPIRALQSARRAPIRSGVTFRPPAPLGGLRYGDTPSLRSADEPSSLRAQRRTIGGHHAPSTIYLACCRDTPVPARAR